MSNIELALAKLYEFSNLYNPDEPGRSLLNEAIALLEQDGTGHWRPGMNLKDIGNNQLLMLCDHCLKPFKEHVGAGNSCPIPYPNYTEWKTQK